MDGQHQNCLHGAYITGVHPGNEQLRSGALLTDYIPVYEADAAYPFNSEEYILPQGTVKGFCAATRPEAPPYWERQKAKSHRAASSDDSRRIKEKYGLETSIPWDDEALAAIMKAPKFVRKMAVGNVEDYAEEQGETRISLGVVTAQAESVGMGKFMRDIGDKPGTGWIRRIFRKRGSGLCLSFVENFQ
jgi:hypothetical protein